MNTLSQLAAAAASLLLAFAPMPAQAAVQLLTSANCGTSGFDSNTGGEASDCSNAGTARTIDNQGSFAYRIQSTAATGYELGGLRDRI